MNDDMNDDEMMARVPDPMNLSHLTDLPQQIARGMRMADMTFGAITGNSREAGEPMSVIQSNNEKEEEGGPFFYECKNCGATWSEAARKDLQGCCTCGCYSTKLRNLEDVVRRGLRVDQGGQVHISRRSPVATLPAATSSQPPILGKQSQEEYERRLDELWATLPPFSLSLVLEGNYYIHRLDLRWKRVYCDVRIIPDPHSCLLVWAGEWLVYEDEEEAGKWLRMWPIGGRKSKETEPK